MPKFRLKYSRRVVQTDTFEEIIEADTLAQAQEIADENASDMDRSCPDEVETSPYDVKCWCPFVVEQVAA